MVVQPGTVPTPFDRDRLAALLSSSWDQQQRIQLIGVLYVTQSAGADVKLRALASRACGFIRVHVQDDSGSNGGSTYDPDNYTSSTRRDVRESRQLDETISRNGTDEFFVWLIPERLNPDGTYTLYDGDDGPDQMTFRSLGV